MCRINIRLASLLVILHLDNISKVIRFKIILLFAVLLQTAIAQENYCHDEATNAYWEDLAIYYADRMDVTNLVKLTKQLCRQVDTGEISVEDATEIFERERNRVVDDMKRGKF